MKKERERSSVRVSIVLVLLLVTLLIAGVIPTVAAGNQRPIEDFVSRQGPFCFNENFEVYGYADPCPADYSYLLVPPVLNFIGWSDPDAHLLASFDYAGLADECAGGAFGTEMSGTITERPLADGRAEVYVRLRTTNALTFVVDDPAGTFDFNGDLLFGQRLEADPWNCGVLPEGTEAALGSSALDVAFINSAPGAPLPDLIQLIYFTDEDQELIRFSFRGQADGLLADGTPGRVEVIQSALFNTGGMGATADGFPAEKIILRAVGQ